MEKRRKKMKKTKGKTNKKKERYGEIKREKW